MPLLYEACKVVREEVDQGVWTEDKCLDAQMELSVSREMPCLDRLQRQFE